MQSHQSSKSVFKNTLANLVIELSALNIKEAESFPRWRSRTIQTFAEFAREKLVEVHYFFLSPGLEASVPKDFSIGLARDLVEYIERVSNDIEIGLFDSLLQKIDSGYESTSYNLTIPQKRVLRILVNLRESGLLFEPIVVFRSSRLKLNTTAGIALDPKDAIREFKSLDFNTFVEENLFSQADNPDGRRFFTIKQSAIIAVNNYFYTSDSSSWNPSETLGSPYGFTKADWVFVRDQKTRRNTVVVSFGHEFDSKNYNSGELIKGLRERLENAILRFNTENPGTPITLDFRVLGAGYGEHLFNDIARNIMSSDIAIFETSDLNPNVMLEMGVALTWGVNVFPIKKKGTPRPPSDISGQTWADYERNGVFIDPDFEKRLYELVTRVVTKKRES